MSHRTAVHDLKSLVLSFHSLIVIETVEEERARALLAEVATDVRLPMYEWSVSQGLNRVHGAAVEGTQDAMAMLKHLRSDFEPAEALFLLKDLGPHLTNPNTSRLLREIVQKLQSTRATIILTGEPVELPKELEGMSVRFDLELPDEEELRRVVRSALDAMGRRQQIHVDLSRDDAQQLVRALSGLTINQARQVICQALVADGALTAEDIERVIRSKGEIVQRGGILEFFPVEENSFEIGGFARMKEWLDNARIGFSREARAMNLEPPKGVLIVGVQGCGKSLAAKFIARQWQLPLLKLDAGRLYEKYVGESEKNFRRATTMAAAMAPVVLWIDEIEKAFAQSTSAESDGGLSQRLFGSFLTWLQEKRAEVFVVGAANDLMRLPPELLRKGRFDEIFFVDLPSRDERVQIFTIHLRLRNQDPRKFNLGHLSDATEGYSGAEIERAVISALYRALQKHTAPATEMILEAVEATVPLSVS
ncbi:MAG: AAA family ATPase, partial [Thermoanaerobaculia bacterium]